MDRFWIDLDQSSHFFSYWRTSLCEIPHPLCRNVKINIIFEMLIYGLYWEKLDIKSIIFLFLILTDVSMRNTPPPLSEYKNRYHIWNVHIWFELRKSWHQTRQCLISYFSESVSYKKSPSPSLESHTRWRKRKCSSPFVKTNQFLGPTLTDPSLT